MPADRVKSADREARGIPSRSSTSTSKAPRRRSSSRRIARRNNLEIPPARSASTGASCGTTSSHFLRIYDRPRASSAPRQDYHDITLEYLASCAGEGAIYVELTASADHAALVGLSDPSSTSPARPGHRRRPRRDRHRGAHPHELRAPLRRREARARSSRRTVERPASLRHRLRPGRRRGGLPARAFARAFEIAREAGLGLTVHAGEWAGPESVRGGLALARQPDRPRRAGDRGPGAGARARGPGHSCSRYCPTSNVVARSLPGATRRTRCQPARRRRARSRSAPTTRRTGTRRIGGEYAVAAERIGFDDDELRAGHAHRAPAAFVEDERYVNGSDQSSRVYAPAHSAARQPPN